MTRTMTLFGSNQFPNQKRTRQRRLSNERQEEPPEVILGTTKEEYAEAIVDEYGFDPVSIDYDGVTVETNYSPREPQFIFLPAAGKMALLRFEPGSRRRTRTFHAELEDDGYRIRLEEAHRGHGSRTDRLQSSVEEAVNAIKTQHEEIEEEVEDFHETLREMARKRYNTRKNEIEHHQRMYDAIDFPVRKREDVPDILTVEPPEKREVIDLDELEDPSDPVRRIPDAAYQQIMDTTNSLGGGAATGTSKVNAGTALNLVPALLMRSSKNPMGYHIQ